MNPPSFSHASVFETAEALKKNPRAQLIDVREPGEFETEHVPGSENLPLSNFASSMKQLNRTAPVYILCQVGARATQAANQLAMEGHPDVVVVNGGLNAWKAADMPVAHGLRRVWPMERQVRFTAGVLILTGIFLSLIVHPGFLALTAFIGAGLTFSGVTGWCGMALILARFPWNRKSK